MTELGSTPPPAWLTLPNGHSDDEASAWPWILTSIGFIHILLLIILLCLMLFTGGAGGASSGGGGASSGGGGASSDGGGESGSRDGNDGTGPVAPSTSDSAERVSESAPQAGGDPVTEGSNAGSVSEEDRREGKKETKIESKMEIVLTWSEEADLDLYVVCPSGETLSYKNTFGDDYGMIVEVSNDAEVPGVKRERATWVTDVTKGTYSVRVGRDGTGSGRSVSFEIDWSQGSQRGKEGSLIGRNEEREVLKIKAR